ncbi:MAG TPA: sugar transferase [Acidimicrobiia bacterium]|jgi:lipopolysaccharide/colanic/teichoic acid biosynthesis glycosyltransferase|nr:sugar transferase [Acidimicrobiia bacterium]
MTDLVSLALAMTATSLIVFDTLLPWDASPALTRNRSVIPMLAFMGISMIAASALTEQMSGPGVPRPSYGRMVAIYAGTLLFTAGMLFVFRESYFSRGFVPIAGTMWLIPATLHRVMRRQRPWTERFGVITKEKTLADDLNDADHAEVAWVLEPDGDSPADLPDRNLTIATDLRAVLSESMARYLSSCDVAGYIIRPFSSIYEEHTGRVPLIHLSEGWEISAPLLEVAHWLPGKRAFDTAFSLLTAPLWVPIGLAVAAYVKAADPGFSVFRQKRVGLNGRIFTMYKFRTMHLDAEKDGARFATEDDPRLIRGGAFLRKTRLDEIPQLWNVVKGDMSLVGPRAEQVPFVSEFRREIPFYDHRHMVRPGITGWAQVNFGYADDGADTFEKLTYDLYYIKHMSPVMDLRIFWKSIWTVITGEGAR